MAVAWTDEQKKVIMLRDRNILVSAAAGSGKTAVLVQRILGKLMDPVRPVDIDRLLIMTFTRAAAGEMKERICRAIEQALQEDPENEHLQRQMTLIHTARITTIDGFCSWLIKNYFHLIDLDPGYRVLDEGEEKLLREDVLKELIEELYQEKDADFLFFSECYAPGKSDDAINNYLMQVYQAAMSHPDPKGWMDSALESFRCETQEELQRAPWYLQLWQAVQEELSGAERLVEEALALSQRPGGPYLYTEALEDDLFLIRHLEKLAEKQEYGESRRLLLEHSFARLSTARGKDIEPSLKETVKNLRDEEKELLKELRTRYFHEPEEQLLILLQSCRRPMETLVRITERFIVQFSERKREKNLVDFTDLEHFALKILLNTPALSEQSEAGNVQIGGAEALYSEAARELSERFDEVLVDEYQDSNLVQELLTGCVSGWVNHRKNIFMVGDVKQSIYRFRMARPELFMEKYKNYTPEDSEEQRIDLHKNFRSRPEVLSFVNFLFRQLMGEDLGGITYDAAAALYPGADYPPKAPGSSGTEVLLIEKDAQIPEEDEEPGNARELEALAVGHRILELVGKEQVQDKETGSLRPAEYGDIAVLLRTSAGWSETFSQVFESLGIPAYTASRTGYFAATEVVTVLNYLQICDNPLQDLPLVGVLRSPIGGFTSQELAEIRAACPEGLFFESVRRYIEVEAADELCNGYNAVEAVDDLYEGQRESSAEEKTEAHSAVRAEIVAKLQSFLNTLEDMRDLAEYTPIHELISVLLQSTGYGRFVRALPGGEQRSANLRMLVEKAIEFEKTSYRGLFHFVRYVESLQKYEVDFGEVSLAGAGQGCVQIMTIHKSKGLEFPIVFAAGMGKPFNVRDTQARLLIHPELGFGVDAIFPDRRLIVPSLLKQVIRKELQRDNLGEELRVLYVALTRAKEKLILTGAVGKLEKTLRRFSRFGNQEKELLPISARMQAKSYWDFVLPALVRHSCMDELFLDFGILPSGYLPGGEQMECTVRVIRPEELVIKELKHQVNTGLREELLKNWDVKKVYDPFIRERLEARFSYVYPYRGLWEIPVKVSVSELKKRGYRDAEEEEAGLYVEHDIIPLIPDFISGESKNSYTGAARGTAYHRVMECLDYHKVSKLHEIEEQIAELEKQQKLTKEEAACVQPEDIRRFLDTPLGERMRQAGITGRLIREQPFVISQRADLLDARWSSDANVLVQGIIDAYFSEDEGLILVDYKTDKVTDGTGWQLIDTYHIQLEDYAAALERLTGKKVREMYIYSFTLGKALLL